MIGAWAEQTERVEFGTLVSCNSYRNADLQADMARTIDHISAKGDGPGRFIFGTGSGWFQQDYDEYGYEFGTPGTRLNALADAMPRIEARWAKLDPPPTRRIPVMIGGKGEQKTLKIVARHADIWHSFVSPADLPHKLDVLARWGDEVGRDVSQITVSNELTRHRVDLDYADALYDAGVRLFTLGHQRARLRPRHGAASGSPGATRRTAESALGDLHRARHVVARCQLRGAVRVDGAPDEAEVARHEGLDPEAALGEQAVLGA